MNGCLKFKGDNVTMPKQSPHWQVSQVTSGEDVRGNRINKYSLENKNTQTASCANRQAGGALD